MDTTTLLTAGLPVILVGSAALTEVVSFLLLRLYHRAVVRGMAKAAAAPAIAAPLGEPGTTPPPELRVTMLDPAAGRMQGDDARAGAMIASTWRTAAVHAAGGLVYAAIFTVAWGLAAGGGLPPGRLAVLIACFAWPTALAIGLVAARGRRDRMLIGAGYGAVLLAAAAFAMARNPDLAVAELAFLWLFLNGPATVLIAAFLHRRVRAVGPLVLTFAVAGVTGAVLLVVVVGSDDRLLWALAGVSDALGLGALSLFVLLLLIGFALLAVVGWLVLRQLGARYRAKRTSDQLLMLDALLLVFAITQPLTLAFDHPLWVLSGLVGFAGYKLTVRLAFALSRGETARGPMLLILRVFALGRRSEQLLDALGKGWLRKGPIGLIAGPDLITTTVEPHEFLDFVGGRLSRQFVQGPDDLARRIEVLDIAPDPDGRHRVNEMFCHADTWQATMVRLAGLADAVLMDLRGFAPSNRGCLFEIEQLLAAVPLERVVLLVDDTTDREFLEASLRDIWPSIPAASPNRRASDATLRVLNASAGSTAPTRALLALLLAPPGAAAGTSG